MPQVFKREWTATDGKTRTSEVYYARFQVNGKDIVRSTGETQKPATEKMIREMIAEEKDGDGVRLHLKRLKFAVSRLPEPEQAKQRRQIASRLLGGINQKLALEKV